MARPDDYSESMLQFVADLAGEWIATTSDFKSIADSQVELAETLSVWTLPIEAIRPDLDDLRDVAVDSGLWHHQIYVDDQIWGYVKSVSQPKLQPPRIAEITPSGGESQLAGELNSTIEWIDANIDQDWIARLLVITSYHIQAIWLQADRESFVVVVTSPTRYAEIRKNFRYPARDLMKILANIAPIRGGIPVPIQ